MNLFRQLWRLFRMMRRVGGWRAVGQLARSAPRYVRLFRRLLGDARVSVLAKAVLVGGLIFAVSPLNLPSFIPFVGPLDEIGIALLVGTFFLRQAPADVLAEHKRAVGLRDRFEPA